MASIYTDVDEIRRTIAALCPVVTDGRHNIQVAQVLARHICHLLGPGVIIRAPGGEGALSGLMKSLRDFYEADPASFIPATAHPQSD